MDTLVKALNYALNPSNNFIGVVSAHLRLSGLALLLAARNRTQAALMAPTEVLAEQHAATLVRLLSGAGVRLALLTGRVQQAEAAGAVFAGID